MKTPILFSIVLTIHGLALGSFLLTQGCTTRSGISARSPSGSRTVATASDTSNSRSNANSRSVTRTRSSLNADTVPSAVGTEHVAVNNGRSVSSTPSRTTRSLGSRSVSGQRPLPPRRGTTAPGTRQPPVVMTSAPRSNVSSSAGARSQSWTPSAQTMPPVTARATTARRSTGATVASNSTEGSTVYVIKKGDVLSRVANKHGLRTKELAEFNGLATPDSIRVGQKILLPAHAKMGGSSAVRSTSSTPRTSSTTARKPAAKPAAKAPSGGQNYTVRKGDSLSLIAYRYGTTVSSLRSANQMSGDQIKVGQTLVVVGATKNPGTSGVTTAHVSKPAPKKPAVKVPAIKPPVAKTPSVTGFKKIEQIAVPTTNSTLTQPVINGNVGVPAKTGTTTINVPEIKAPVVSVPSVITTAPGPVAPVAPAPVDKQLEQAFEYVVQDGESIEDIARAFIVSEDDVRKLNKLGNGEKVRPGQTLKIPPSIF